VDELNILSASSSIVSLTKVTLIWSNSGGGCGQDVAILATTSKTAQVELISQNFGNRVHWNIANIGLAIVSLANASRDHTVLKALQSRITPTCADIAQSTFWVVQAWTQFSNSVIASNVHSECTEAAGRDVCRKRRVSHIHDGSRRRKQAKKQNRKVKSVVIVSHDQCLKELKERDEDVNEHGGFLIQEVLSKSADKKMDSIEF
jgi:hypothetical protein